MRGIAKREKGNNQNQARSQLDASERTQNFVTNSQGIEILSQSMWPLDGRLAFDGATDGGSVPVKTAGDFASQAEGELLNSFNTVHSPFVSGSTVCGDTYGRSWSRII